MKTIVLKSNLIHAGNLILVNARHPYKEGVAERTLLPVNSETNEILLERHVVDALSSLMDRLDGWTQIAAVSGWRSMREQEKIYQKSINKNGDAFTEKYVALPGHSEHQTGLAVDLALKQANIDFIRPDFPYWGVCQTFRQDMIAYGFIERYPQYKELQTGIAHEPWHFRYVGAPHAEIMTRCDIVLEEYIALLKQYPFETERFIYTTKDRNTTVALSFLAASKAVDTLFEIDDTLPYSVSGNNIDGFIITEWRKQNGGK